MKVPKLLADYRAVWESDRPPPGGESQGRKFLRALKDKSLEKFLGDMRKEEAEYAKRRDAAKRLDAQRERAGELPPADPGAAERVDAAALMELIDRLLGEAPQ